MMCPVRCDKPGAAGLHDRCNTPMTRCRRRQSGSMLLEAVVGIAVSAALGLGMAYSAARALKAQRYSTTQNLAVLQMRTLLTVPGDLSAWCAAGSGELNIALNNVTASGAVGDDDESRSTAVPYMLSCSVLTPTITGAGQSATVSLKRPTALSTVDSGGGANSLFGGDGVIRFGP